MKKTLIAIAALAATGAFAQSVAITGTFDPSLAIEKKTYGDNTSVSQTYLRNNSRGTSNVTFRISEDLGAGMSAIGLYELDFNAGAKTDQAAGTYVGYSTATATNGLGALGGELYVGLAGGFGSVKIGAANTPTLASQASRQPFGTKLGGGFGAGNTMGTPHVRESNSIVYASPVMSGFSAALGYAFGANVDANNAAAPAGTVNTPTKSDLGLNYAAGPVAVGATFFTQASTSAKTANTLQTVFARYTMGAFTLMGGFHNESLAVATGATEAKASGMNIAGTYAVSGATTLLANLGKLDDKSTANNDQTITGLGLDYAMSKRTTAYVRYENRKVDNAAATSLKGITTTAFGLQHNF